MPLLPFLCEFSHFLGIGQRLVFTGEKFDFLLFSMPEPSNIGEVCKYMGRSPILPPGDFGHDLWRPLCSAIKSRGGTFGLPLVRSIPVSYFALTLRVNSHHGNPETAWIVGLSPCSAASATSPPVLFAGRMNARQ